MKFKALLLVQSFSFPIARQPQELLIITHPSISEVDLATDDVLFNLITTEIQLCRQRDGKPWRGPKDKSKVLMKLFVHDLSHVGGIVADMIASISFVFYSIQLLIHMFFNSYFNVRIFLINIVLHLGSSIRVAYSSNRHILALVMPNSLMRY